MTELVERLQAARESYVREEYASNVKRLFREHFEDLEPSAQIEDTQYFNHSAIPDFKLSWGHGVSGRASRDVFLRSSYASVVAGDETSRITKGDPVFLSISSAQAVDEPGFAMTSQDVARVAGQSRHTLLTDARAFQEITAPAIDANPLSAIVRSNFLRGARGLVDESRAERLRLSAPPTDGSVTDLIRESFFEDAVFRMERTASLVQWALSPESVVGELPGIEGSMSTDELKSVLPWLLRQGALPDEERFWTSLGSLFTFEQLEELSHDLEGLNLSRLIRANLASWSARRAYLGLNISTENPQNASQHSGESVAVVGTDQLDGWRFDSGTLGFASGPFMVRVSNSGHKLKARPGSSTPKWSATRERLLGYRVRSVSVAGIERAFRVDAKESSNIKDDVDKVVASVEDDYFVDRIEIMLPRPVEEEVEETELVSVDLDFAGGIAVASGPVQIGELVRATANILGRLELDDGLKTPIE